MRAKFPLLLLPALLLLASAAPAVAEGPIPDPFAPAVAGRPLDQIRPARVARPKPMNLKQATAARPVERQAATAKGAVKRAPTARAAAKAAPHAVARAAPLALAAPAAAAAVVPVTQDVPASQRAAKQTLDDRFDANERFSEVGKGTNFARKPLAPGAYFGDRHRSAVHKYFEDHPASGKAAAWRIGEPVPRGAAIKAVPNALLPSLPDLPPGHRYVQLGGDVVMIAEGSKMVVDGISRATR